MANRGNVLSGPLFDNQAGAIEILGKEGLNFFVRFGLGKLGAQKAQICVWFYAIGFRSFDEGILGRASLGSPG